MDPTIRAEGLRKQYGTVVALDSLELAVPEGSVLGLLGPNGAGKTTAVSFLTTLLLQGLSGFVRSDLASDGLAAAFLPPTTPGNVFPTGAGATVALVSVVGWTERPWVQRLALVAVGGAVTDLLLTGQTTPSFRGRFQPAPEGSASAHRSPQTLAA